MCFTTEAQGRVCLYTTAVLTDSKVRAAPNSTFKLQSMNRL